METAQINDQIEQLVAAKKDILARLKEAISNLPDNSKIKRIPGGNAFIASSSDVFNQNNWSPFFHDYSAQHKALVEMIENAQASALAEVLKSARYNRNSFAPEVVSAAKPFVELAIKLFKNEQSHQ